MSEFIDLIYRYLKIGNNLLTSFFKETKIEAPKSNMHWASHRSKQHGQLKNGVRYFKHGFGIDFEDEKWKITIDFGSKGEWNGFDSWKLFLFASSNKMETSFKSESEIQKLLTQSVRDGLLIERESLFFRKQDHIQSYKFL